MTQDTQYITLTGNEEPQKEIKDRGKRLIRYPSNNPPQGLGACQYL